MLLPLGARALQQTHSAPVMARNDSLTSIISDRKLGINTLERTSNNLIINAVIISKVQLYCKLLTINFSLSVKNKKTETKKK